MNVNASKETRVIQVGRWIARIGSIASIAFISFFVIANIVGPEGFGTVNSLGEVVQFLFFPTGICLGMMIAWKWEGLGGFITTGSLIAFYVMRPDQVLNAWITGVAAPGLLFLVCWLLSRAQQLETKEAD